MSERTGDKARFGRERQRKILRRMRIRELRKALERKDLAALEGVTGADGTSKP